MDEKKLNNVDYDPLKDVLKRVILPSGTDAVDNAPSVVTYRMFNCREHLTEIVNLEYFSVTTKITDARSTFARTGLTVLNISSLDLNKITGSADWMFNQNKELTRIYVHPSLATNNTFTTNKAGSKMFEQCSDKLVGQTGKHWNENEINGDRANIDGYFSILP